MSPVFSRSQERLVNQELGSQVNAFVWELKTPHFSANWLLSHLIESAKQFPILTLISAASSVLLSSSLSSRADSPPWSFPGLLGESCVSSKPPSRIRAFQSGIGRDTFSNTFSLYHLPQDGLLLKSEQRSPGRMVMEIRAREFLNSTFQMNNQPLQRSGL